MTNAAPELEPCPGCGRLYPGSDGATHAYIGASAGCWARYGELLALEYGDARLMRWHRLTVDSYAAQHPGVPARRSAQSVHVHLAGLYLTLERGLDGRGGGAGDAAARRRARPCLAGAAAARHRDRRARA